MTKKEIATKYAFAWIGKPYRWGGDDFSGFDCSGFVIEILRAVGVLPKGGDWTANGLFERFILLQVEAPSEGCIALYWNSDRSKVVHVEYCISGACQIGASGGGSRTKTEADAIRDNAYIKIRPIDIKRKPTFIKLLK